MDLSMSLQQSDEHPPGQHGDRPIADYGMIGDTRTSALVASNGAIDWWCVPRFDGEPIFGRLLGGAAAGTFRMGPRSDARVVERHYRTDTATIETTWSTPSGALTLTESMVSDVAGQLLPSTLLVRRLTAHDAPVDAVVEFDPRLGEHHRAPRSDRRGDVLVCSWGLLPGLLTGWLSGSLSVSLSSSGPVPIEPGRAVDVRIEPGQPLTVVVSVADREPLVHVPPDLGWAALEADERGWREWCDDVDENLPRREHVVRSLLTLRLLTYSPSGAPVAAPTTSLPEDRGGIRNWDYRYAWPRDASIGVGAFLGVGKQREARHFLAWLLHASRLDRPRLPVLLTLRGGHPPPERSLDSWPGYASSRPVRVGNGASEQHQLDGYGWVLDAAWLLTSAGHRLYGETWRAMRAFADEVADRWRGPDAGIWEIRGDGAHHVHSKLMAWLALDRALRIADTRRTPARQTERWRNERAAIAADVADHGFDADIGSYTRTYGSADLDAALLILPLLGLEPPDSQRLQGTIAAIARELSAGGPLVYRYPPGDDGLPGREGAFLPCSFWLVQALAMTGRTDEARQRFDDLIAMGSPLGLFSEEMDPTTGEHLGNYPQALTHAALVQAALALRDNEPTLPPSPG